MAQCAWLIAMDDASAQHVQQPRVVKVVDGLMCRGDRVLEQKRSRSAFAHHLVDELPQGGARDVIRIYRSLFVSEIPVASSPANVKGFDGAVMGELRREGCNIDGVTRNTLGGAD